MTREEIRKYIDNKISHAISAVEYGNYFYEQIKHFADSAKDDCESLLDDYGRCGTKERYKMLLKDINVRLLELEDDVAAFVNTELPKIIEEEDNWLEKNIEEPFGIKLKKDIKALAKLSVIPIAVAGAAVSFGKHISDSLKSIYSSEATQGYVTDISFNELKDDYSARLNSFDIGLQADAETMGESLGDQYERIVYTKNKEAFKKYMWSSILDTSTCIVCGSLDGQVFDDITKVPVYPQHDRCRCTIIPLPEEASEEDVKETYSHWFERQTDKKKYEILGKKRFELYEQGMKIKQFVNNGKITPLKDLKNNKSQ